ncbi:hypothetical protein KAR48_10050 [bacterium]|nr:hypothetical protein [bacterium]
MVLQLHKNNFRKTILGVLAGFFFLPMCVYGQTAPEGLPDTADRYYMQMKKEEFLFNLLPKEKFLLFLVQNVSAEMDKRKAEGGNLEALGINELTTPEDKKIQEYRDELNQTLDLMDEIARLERVAKQRVDIETLEALSLLKTRVREILELNNPGVDIPETSSTTTIESDSPIVDEPTPLSDEVLNDIYEQWRLNRILQYKMKHTQYEFLRLRLLRTANPRQQERMFRRALKKALEIYSSGDLEFSRIVLSDLITVYNDGRLLDDVKYFVAEAAYGLNRLDEALAGYQRIENDHPQSEYAARGLVKQIYIKYIYSKYNSIPPLYNRLLLQRSLLSEEDYGRVSYLVGYTHFRTGEYVESMSALANVPAGTGYFYPSIYLSAACYTNMGKDDLAIPIYERLVNENTAVATSPVLIQIQNNSLLKLGLIYYEKGSNEKAISCFNRVSASSNQYDLNLMARAWSAYKSGRPGEALRDVEAVLESSVLSGYMYEAKVLAASSKELLGQSGAAIDDLKSVVLAKHGDTDDKLNENKRIGSGVTDFEKSQQSALTQRNKKIFDELEHIRKFFQLAPGGDSELSGQRQFDRERRMLEGQVSGLDKLEREARQRGNQAALNRIRQLRSNALEALGDHEGKFAFTPDDPMLDPLIQRLGLDEYFRYMFRSLLTETMREKEATLSELVQTEAILNQAKNTDNFDATLDAEIRKEELNDYYARLNQYEVWLRENTPEELSVDLDRWASFSGYGISAINFNRIKEIENRMLHVSRVINTMDRIFIEKRRSLDLRIRGLLDDVAVIEKEMQREADQRTRSRQDKFFKTDYFDPKRKESAIEKMDVKTLRKKGGE